MSKNRITVRGADDVVVTTELYSEQIGIALRTAWGDRRHATKRIAQMANATDRAARNWMDGLCGPQSAALILLMAREPAVDQVVRAMIERQRQLDAELAARRARRNGQAVP